ncbi:MAG: malK 2 [Devosia sp.]|uniref:TOBE domain-containing protein n=1 Tax=Devosia sp. TaxID=1871048 RepID=UPI00262B6FCE|nr:TOBE domain-containing protein [Devosia sp.]MDB5585561.1 malK 2 [Devosia sp.]
MLGVRPEDLVLTTGPALVRCTASIIENLGELAIAYVDVGGAEPLIVKLPGDSALRQGDTVALSAPQSRLHLFGADGNTLRPASAQAAI